MVHATKVLLLCYIHNYGPPTAKFSGRKYHKFSACKQGVRRLYNKQYLKKIPPSSLQTDSSLSVVGVVNTRQLSGNMQCILNLN